MSNILITGGCGFIGSNFIKLIQKRSDNINTKEGDRPNAADPGPAWAKIQHRRNQLKFSTDQ